jgi:hypothetical protein
MAANGSTRTGFISLVTHFVEVAIGMTGRYTDRFKSSLVILIDFYVAYVKKDSLDPIFVQAVDNINGTLHIFSGFHSYLHDFQRVCVLLPMFNEGIP